MLTRAQKQERIDALRSELTPAQGLFVMDFSGLSVAEVTELRRKVKEAEAGYVVVKNTLAKIALRDSAQASLEKIITGPSAVAYTSADAARLAKALAEFAKTHDKLKFRGGLVEGTLLDAAGAQKVAALPSKAELVARLLYLLQSPMRRLVTALNWPTKALAVTVKQIADARGNQA